MKPGEMGRAYGREERRIDLKGIKSIQSPID
jgi:hypothetical protein